MAHSNARTLTQRVGIAGISVCALLATTVLPAGLAHAQDDEGGGGTTRSSGAITAASLTSDKGMDPKTKQKTIPQNIINGSQEALKAGYVSAASPFYLTKKLAASAANGSSLAKEGNADFYRSAVANLSNERPGWEMMVPSKALKLANVEADKFERAAAQAVATRYTQLASDPNVKQTGPKVSTRKGNPVKSKNSDSGEEGADTDANADGCVIALDPGHNPTEISDVDPKTKALMKDYPNGAEDKNVFEVATKVKTALEGKGYKVVLLKEKVDESINYRERINRAEKAGAKVAVSIHTTPGSAGSEVFPQRLGGWRSPPGDPSKKVEFKNAETAKASEKYSGIVATERGKVEGKTVPVKDNSFSGRAPLWDGNLPIISLLSEEVPWVYNEFGTDSGGGANPISPGDIDKYAKGLTAGIAAAIKCEKPKEKPKDSDESAAPSSSAAPSTDDDDSDEGTPSSESTEPSEEAEPTTGSPLK